MKNRWFRVASVALAISGCLAAAAFWGHRFDAAAQDTPKPLPKPPDGQTFVGTKVCGSCHFEQHLDWKKTKHAKAFEVLPAKYQADKSCLKCHVTGLGEPNGFVDMEKTPDLAGTACETCHGPGSKHAEIAKTYTGKTLTKDQESYVRSTIYKIQPKNVCVDCHLTRAHKKHPEYDKN